MEFACPPAVCVGSLRVLHLPPAVQKHAREMNRELEIVHTCVCEYEWLYVFQCGPAMNCQLVQGVTPSLAHDSWNGLQQSLTTLKASKNE